METTNPDWVVQHAKCRLDVVFASLKEIVDRDVQAMTGLDIRERGESKYFCSATPTEISVWRQLPPKGDEVVAKFVVSNNPPACIVINASNETFDAYVRWDKDARECALEVDRQYYSFGALSRRFLEPIFFPADH